MINALGVLFVHDKKGLTVRLSIAEMEMPAVKAAILKSL